MSHHQLTMFPIQRPTAVCLCCISCLVRTKSSVGHHNLYSCMLIKENDEERETTETSQAFDKSFTYDKDTINKVNDKNANCVIMLSHGNFS